MGIIKNFLNKYILHPSFLIKEEGDMIQKEEDYCDQFSKIQIDINNIKSSYPEMIRKSLEYDFKLELILK